MDRNIMGIIASFLYVLFVIGFAFFLKKKYNANSEITRKSVHILSGNWIFISHYFFDSLEFAIIAPMCFILINYLSLKYHLISVIEREQVNAGEIDSYGTVYYSISTLLLIIFDYVTNSEYASYMGLLIMAYGDGFAALIGKKYGRKSSFFKEKTFAGSVTLFLISFLISLGIFCFFIGSIMIFESLLISMLAVLLEFHSSRGSDNLTLPLGLAIYTYLLINFTGDTLIATFLNLIIILFAYYKKSLTKEGMIFSFFTGIILFAFGKYPMYSALVTFFIAGSLLSKFKNLNKKNAEELHKRNGCRGGIQVISNSLPAVFILSISHIFNLPLEYAYFAGITCISAACADTFASELGMLSSRDPVSILNFKTLKRGLSGGVSIIGFFSAMCGSFLIATFIFFYREFGVDEFFIVFILGFSGSVLDSIFGALFQVKYLYKDGSFSERDDLESIVVKKYGFSFIDNDVVNLISVSIATFAGYLIIMMINK